MVIWARSRSLEKSVHSFCLVRFFFVIKRHWQFLLLHIQIGFDPMVCLGLDPQSCVQVQGHCKRKCTNPSWPYFVMEKDRKLNFDTKIAWDLNICPDLELWPSASSQEKIMAFQQMKYLHVLSEDIICELVLFFFT